MIGRTDWSFGSVRNVLIQLHWVLFVRFSLWSLIKWKRSITLPKSQSILFRQSHASLSLTEFMSENILDEFQELFCLTGVHYSSKQSMPLPGFSHLTFTTPEIKGKASRPYGFHTSCIRPAFSKNVWIYITRIVWRETFYLQVFSLLPIKQDSYRLRFMICSMS